jgi:hypothetical protein
MRKLLVFSLVSTVLLPGWWNWDVPNGPVTVQQSLPLHLHTDLLHAGYRDTLRERDGRTVQDERRAARTAALRWW